MRKRGTRTRTAVTVSAMPSSSAAARLRFSRHLGLCQPHRHADRVGDLPEARGNEQERRQNRRNPVRRLVFQPGSSSGAIASSSLCHTVVHAVYSSAVCGGGVCPDRRSRYHWRANIYGRSGASCGLGHRRQGRKSARGGRRYWHDLLVRRRVESTRAAARLFPDSSIRTDTWTALGDSLEMLDLRGTKSERGNCGDGPQGGAGPQARRVDSWALLGPEPLAVKAVSHGGVDFGRRAGESGVPDAG